MLALSVCPRFDDQKNVMECIITQSNGRASIVTCSNGASMVSTDLDIPMQSSLDTEPLELWCGAFDGNKILLGSDDCQMKWNDGIWKYNKRRYWSMQVF